MILVGTALSIPPLKGSMLSEAFEFRLIYFIIQHISSLIN